MREPGRELTTHLIHRSYVRSAEFSPDGLSVLTACQDGIARTWDSATGQPAGPDLKGDGAMVVARFSPNGASIVTASNPQGGTALRIWDWRTGKALAEPTIVSGSIASAAFSRDGTRIVTASYEGSLAVFDVRTGHAIAQWNTKGMLASVEFSPDGKSVLTASGCIRFGSNETTIWDAESGSATSEPLKHGGQVTTAHFSPDGKRILTASYDRMVRVWDAQPREAASQPLFHQGEVTSAQISRDGQRIVTAASEKIARIWDAHTGELVVSLSNEKTVITLANFSPDGRRVVTACPDGTAQIWDSQTGQPLSQPIPGGGEIKSIEFNPDATSILAAYGDGTARIWDSKTGRMLTNPLTHQAAVNSAHFSHAGNLIVTASGDQTVRVWDSHTGLPLTPPLKHESDVYSANFSPDGSKIVSASTDHTARVWDARTGQQLLRPLQHDAQVWSAQFSPDGKRIVTACKNNNVRIWDALTGQTLTDLGEAGQFAQFSSNERILTASESLTTRPLWDARTGKDLINNVGRNAEVKCVASSTDESRIVTGRADGITYITDISPQGTPPPWLADLAEAVAGEKLNRRGVFESLTEQQLDLLNDLRRRLEIAPSSNDWTVWGRWLLADASNRTISPASKMTYRQYRERHLPEQVAAKEKESNAKIPRRGPAEAFLDDVGEQDAELLPRQAAGGVLFRCSAPHAKVIYLAGDFNAWANNHGGVIDDKQFAMEGPDEKGVWQKLVKLAPGTYHFRFNFDGKVTQWFTPDSIQTRDKDDNAVITVGSDGNVHADVNN